MVGVCFGKWEFERFWGDLQKQGGGTEWVEIVIESNSYGGRELVVGLQQN